MKRTVKSVSDWTESVASLPHKTSWALLLLPIVAVGCKSGEATHASSDLETKQAAVSVDDGKAVGKSKEKTPVWVVLKDQANLATAHGISDWKARGKFVHDELKNTANTKQAGLRAWLKKRGVEHESFWIVNTLKVTADQATIDEIAKRPDVAQILEDKPIPLPPLLPADGPSSSTLATEWGLDSIRAPEAWAAFGVGGEGIVVANIDTGVEYTHPALANQYRGRQADGTYNHNYNWFDPANVCASGIPCDNNAHGTHTMGTMVGDDGSPGTNRIGVAPRAKWIAAKGCESNSCSTASLLSSGQWILAPTDLTGQNPRSDLRPNVVNNSWGGAGGRNFYQAVVQSWVAAGIFPAFSNGNSGSSCSSSGSPGDYPESFSAGAYDSTNVIAGFSSRGPSAFGSIIKPNIAAPGVNVRSSVPGPSYAAYSGTSMASPHVAGAVALLWSAAPSLVGDIAATRTLLSTTAVDTSDTICGGTAANNNVWGEGKLDIYTAILQAPRGPTGTLRGQVTSSSGGAAISGATVTIAGGSITRTAVTDTTGNYQITLPVATYTVSATAYGYVSPAPSQATITQGQTTVKNFALVPAPSHSLSGRVKTAQNEAIANAKVTILGTPIAPAITDATGAYSFATVPDGEYDVKVEAGRCVSSSTQHVTIASNATLDFALAQRRDSFGYGCSLISSSYVNANTLVALTGDDSYASIALPFAFTFYGQSYSTAYVSTNGFISFTAGSATYTNDSIPSSYVPNGAVYALWDDLYVDGSTGTIRTETVGTAPNRKFVIEWRDVRFYGTTAPTFKFEIVLLETGQIQLQYGTVGSDPRVQGNSATLGIENASGTVALQYSNNEAVISNNFAVQFAVTATCQADADCGDSMYCNGAERCVSGTCQAGTPVDCNDNISCTADVCNEASDSCTHAPSNNLCSDGTYCNGAETCDPTQGCVAGTPVDCNDSISCTTDACNEASQSCTHTADNAACSDGAYCNGAETCNLTQGCVAGTPPCSSGQTCNEEQDACQTGPCTSDADCSDGTYCNGTEQCVDGTCHAGTPVECNDNISCTVDTCNEASRSCTHAPNNTACSDGTFCNGAEVCNPTQGCVAGTPPNCNDNISCTVDTCNEASQSCAHAPNNTVCSDGAFCNGAEVCNPTQGCVAGPPPNCNDNISCTTDACSEASQSCTHAPNNALCDNGMFCDGAETCSLTQGCVAGTSPCASPLYCSEPADACVACLTDAHCSDNLFCNGVESCVNGACQAGTAPNCSDNIPCTVDACVEASQSCTHTADNAVCSDGLFCNGAEVCSLTQGCTAGTPPCSAGQTCDEPTDQCRAPACTSDAQCDDGNFCNGQERCTSGSCVPGTPWGQACVNATPLARNQQSGPFGTTGEKWFVVTDNINGWQASEVTGRTIRVNGVTVNKGQMPLPAKYNGKRYFQFTGTGYTWSSWSCW